MPEYEIKFIGPRGGIHHKVALLKECSEVAEQEARRMHPDLRGLWVDICRLKSPGEPAYYFLFGPGKTNGSLEL